MRRYLLPFVLCTLVITGVALFTIIQTQEPSELHRVYTDLLIVASPQEKKTREHEVGEMYLAFLEAYKWFCLGAAVALISVWWKRPGSGSSDAPEYWQTHFQDGATGVVLDTYEFYDDLAGVMVLVAVFVAWLAFRALWQFSSLGNTQNPKSRFQHHTQLEVWWTLVPTFILLWIAAPSLTLLYSTEAADVPDVTVRVIGRQWYWSYELGDKVIVPLPPKRVVEYTLRQNPILALGDLARWERTHEVSLFDYLGSNGLVDLSLFCTRAGGMHPSYLEVFYTMWPEGPAHNDFFDSFEELAATPAGLNRVLGFMGTSTAEQLASEEAWTRFFSDEGVTWVMLSEAGQNYEKDLLFARAVLHGYDFHDLIGRRYSFCTEKETWVPQKKILEPMVWDSTLAARPSRTQGSRAADYPELYPLRRAGNRSPRFSTHPRWRGWERAQWRSSSEWWRFGYPDYNMRNWLLSVQQPLILPDNRPLRLLATATDVIHSWAVPSFGIKIDACPGRLNQVLFTIMRSGTFYGQCSEICGVNHAFMPIEVKAIPFRLWKYFAAAPSQVLQALDLSTKARLEQSRIFRYSWTARETYLSGLGFTLPRITR